MRTYDAWFPRYALGNGLMFFCRVFSPPLGRGSSALSTFLDRRTQRVDYSIGESIYMIPSDMNLKIRSGTVGYNNKILVSNEMFILGKNEKVNSLETPAIKNHKTNSLETPAMKSTQTVVNSERTADLEQKTIISHEDEKVALVLSLTGIFTTWFIFR